MPARDRERYDMLIRIRNFGTEYGQLFPESSLARQAFADLTSALDEGAGTTSGGEESQYLRQPRARHQRARRSTSGW